MSNQPPVKIPLTSTQPEPPVEGRPEAPADPKITALVRLLRPVPEPKVHPEAEARLSRATRMDVSLAQHQVRVLQGDLVLVEAPLATGRSLSPTPEGAFVLEAKTAAPASLRYGHYRARSGALLVRGVFPRFDPPPPEAVFDPISPKAVLKLSGEGPLLFGGEATGAATSDGSIVLPDKIATLLHDKLPLGLAVVVGR